MEGWEMMLGSTPDARKRDRTERAGGPWKRMRHHSSSMPASPVAAGSMGPSHPLVARPALSSQPSPPTRLQVILRSVSASGAPSQAPSRNTTTESPLLSSKALPARPAQPPTTPLSTHQAPSPATPMGDTGDGNSASQLQRRGRPKGWKAGMSYAELRGDPPPSRARKSARAARSSSTAAATAAATPEGGSKRRGRPAKPPPLTPREQFLKSEPRYMSFGCEWHGRDPSGEPSRCPAELQNMDTLRQHVFLIHGDADTLVCRWGRCSHAQPVVFADEETFRAHVEKAHFRSYVWHMGDGIQNKGISTLRQDTDNPPLYLFDRDGNLVTPSVKDQLLEDTKGMLERKKKLREIQRLAQENAPDESEFALPLLE